MKMLGLGAGGGGGGRGGGCQWGFWREESLACLAGWLQSLLNYSPAGNNNTKKKQNKRGETCSRAAPSNPRNLHE